MSVHSRLPSSREGLLSHWATCLHQEEAGWLAYRPPSTSDQRAAGHGKSHGWRTSCSGYSRGSRCHLLNTKDSHKSTAGRTIRQNRDRRTNRKIHTYRHRLTAGLACSKTHHLVHTYKPNCALIHTYEQLCSVAACGLLFLINDCTTVPTAIVDDDQ